MLALYSAELVVEYIQNPCHTIARYFSLPLSASSSVLDVVLLPAVVELAPGDSPIATILLHDFLAEL